MKILVVSLLCLAILVTNASALERTRRFNAETTLKIDAEVKRQTEYKSDLTPSEIDNILCQQEMHTVCCDASGGFLDPDMYCGWESPFGSSDDYFQCLLDLCGSPDDDSVASIF